MKLLHITTHMGGGVGHALSDLVIKDKQNEHIVYLLQRPEKMHYIKKCIDYGIKVYDTDTSCEILMQYADIVILHWWHHPYMCKFLFEFPEVQVRLILWSHVSGCSYPFLDINVVDKFDKILATSKYTMENIYWKKKKELITSKMSLVYGMGELRKLNKKECYENNGKIKIGYVGTLSKSKINSSFPISCKQIIERISNVEFYLIGDISGSEWIKEEVVELGIEKKIHFIGYVENINDWLLQFDIFGYPLNPYHYGTTENSVLEAMAVGLPVVLLNQATEKYIVEHRKDGILAKDMEDYVEQIMNLIYNQVLREKIGRQAAQSVAEKFSFEENINSFLRAIEDATGNEVRYFNFKDILGKEPHNWFLSAVNPEDKKVFLSKGVEMHAIKDLVRCKPIFGEKNKSSVVHFANSYPEDKILKLWLNEINDETVSGKEETI